MFKKPKDLKEKVFFNASVVLAGLRSPAGGSARLLFLSKKQKITGIISEIILDEVIRHASKIGLKKSRTDLLAKSIFKHIEKAPNPVTVKKCQKLVIDPGDAHVLASCQEVKTRFLVTLDKKHLLILRKKIKWVKIVSPGELLEILFK